MKYVALPVIERTTTETLEAIETNGQSGGIPIWGILILVLVSLLLVAVIVLLIFVIKRGKKEIIKEVRVENVERDRRVRPTELSAEERAEMHSNQTRKLWNQPVKGEGEEMSLIIRDIVKPDKIYKRALSDFIIVGRNQGDVHIDYDRFISSPHCEFSYESGVLYVRDLNSTNGTYIEDRKITKKTIVVNGGIVKLGETELRVEVIKGKVTAW